MNNSTFKNVTFRTSNETVEPVLAMIDVRRAGTIQLNAFSIHQLIMGALHWDEIYEVYKASGKKLMNLDAVKSLIGENQLLLMKLYEWQRTLLGKEYTDATVVDITLTRDEVETLKLFIDARMLHCEGEKEMNNPAFNADTYIHQKLLYVELVQWLSVKSWILMSDEKVEKAVHA